MSGITNLSLNSIDVLSGLDTVKICVAYDLDGQRIDHYPASLEQLKRCQPIYEELPGWSEDITGVRSLEDLPENARNYVRRVSELVGVRISTFSVGPGREQTKHLGKRLVKFIKKVSTRKLLLVLFCRKISY